MFCKQCGTQLEENAKFCPSCGAKNEEINQVQENQQPSESNAQTEEIQTSKKTKFSGLAIASFVLSLVGILIAGIPCGILGIVFASIAMRKISIEKLRGKGLAIAGFVISILDVVLVVAML